jgi:hypothetical protein
MVDEVVLQEVFLRVLQFFLLIIIPPLLRTHLSPSHEVGDSPDQAAHYHTLGCAGIIVTYVNLLYALTIQSII